MHLTAVRWVLVVVFGLASAPPLFAQFGMARLSHADGAVTRLHRAAPAATTIGVSLMDGDQIETADGRAEVTFLDGTILHLDTHTRVVVNGNGRLQLLDGRVFLRTSGLKPYVNDTPAGPLRVLAASIAELTARAETRDVLLRVVSGSARVECPSGHQPVNAYYSAMLTGPTCHAMVTQWIPPQTDEFERWASLRTVMATSTPMPGTESGDRVNYGWGYFGNWWYYGAPSYLHYPVYTSPGPVNPYYDYDNYNAGSHYSYGYPAYRERVYQRRSEPAHRPSNRLFVPPSAPPPAPGPPARGMGAGAVIRPPS